MTKYEVKIFVQTTEIYMVDADSKEAAVDVAVDRFGRNDPAEFTEDQRIVETDVEKA